MKAACHSQPVVERAVQAFRADTALGWQLCRQLFGLLSQLRSKMCAVGRAQHVVPNL